MHRSISSFLIPAALVLILAAGRASATPFWSDADVQDPARWQVPAGPVTQLGEELISRLGEAPRSEIEYIEMYSLIAHFLSTLQVDTPGPDFGGMREGEHLLDIIQTDNTSESIWVWSRYYELTGDNQYYQNILDAFTYSLNHPAYLEENGSAPLTGYYRMYNCGWAVTAELKFQQVYGDDTYFAYGDSCGSYIRYNELQRPTSGFYHFVNPPVYSWALGNLYNAGAQTGNMAWMNAAVTKAGQSVKDWVEGEPTLLSNETWAMSGGATMWGLINSYFRRHEAEMPAWLQTYKGYMDTFATSGDFTNAWNGWYALGHRAVGEALLDAYHLGVHVVLTDTLIAEDGDGDGGIPARPEDLDTMDQTWVSNYLAFMGLNPLLPAAADVPNAPLARSTGTWRLAAWPNPCRGPLTLSWDAPMSQVARFTIVDASGRLVARLEAGQPAAGMSSVTWNGRDSSGRQVSAGTYWAVARDGDRTAARPVLMLR
jgi:hypothetical protein